MVDQRVFSGDPLVFFTIISRSMKFLPATFDSQVVERAFEELDQKPAIVAGLNVPMPYNHTLEGMVIPSEEKIKQTVLQMMDKA